MINRQLIARRGSLLPHLEESIIFFVSRNLSYLKAIQVNCTLMYMFIFPHWKTSKLYECVQIPQTIISKEGLYPRN